MGYSIDFVAIVGKEVDCNVCLKDENDSSYTLKILDKKTKIAYYHTSKDCIQCVNTMRL